MKPIFELLLFPILFYGLLCLIISPIIAHQELKYGKNFCEKVELLQPSGNSPLLTEDSFKIFKTEIGHNPFSRFKEEDAFLNSVNQWLANHPEIYIKDWGVEFATKWFCVYTHVSFITSIRIDYGIRKPHPEYKYAIVRAPILTWNRHASHIDYLTGSWLKVNTKAALEWSRNDCT